MDLSVIMSTFNRPEDTGRFLQSLTFTSSTRPLEWEVIAVDNNSTDNTPDVIADQISRVNFPLRLVRERRKGRSAGINAGIHASSGRYIAFTDDDILVTPNWCQSIVDYLDKNPEVGCVGGKVKLYDSRDAPITINESPDLAIVTLDSFTPFNTPLLGCNTAIRRSLLDTLGSLDVELGVGTPTYSGEDVDLIYRVLKSGFQVHYVPDIAVYHNHGRRTSDQLTRLRKGYARGLGAFYAKHIKLRDPRVTRWAYWDLRQTLSRHLVPSLWSAQSRREILQFWNVVSGMLVYQQHHRRTA